MAESFYVSDNTNCYLYDSTLTSLLTTISGGTLGSCAVASLDGKYAYGSSGNVINLLTNALEPSFAWGGSNMIGRVDISENGEYVYGVESGAINIAQVGTTNVSSHSLSGISGGDCAVINGYLYCGMGGNFSRINLSDFSTQSIESISTIFAIARTPDRSKLVYNIYSSGYQRKLVIATQTPSDCGVATSRDVLATNANVISTYDNNTMKKTPFSTGIAGSPLSVSGSYSALASSPPTPRGSLNFAQTKAYFLGQSSVCDIIDITTMTVDSSPTVHTGALGLFIANAGYNALNSGLVLASFL